ncbi:peptide chain release factor N(5)-glutamine methyltransferase [Qipengyuania atrilutea]|uniref:Release factor glutamine methyltransferase n=1 Tax=Qipengyuania atrilutea TaxID=2744473 RepID=A0A850H4A5_9SPHN|nr:peptide chain release factor N(5)-glutamine methyltransferase [Actirhodobacter atriluteus]NVD44703.1 peptide chain release factor N(5)-glutamine methyltransferase [Actirhodobacter atriluteus]
MTVGEAIRAAAEALAVEWGRLDAEVLMAHALGVSRSDMLLRHMRDPVPDGFASLLERRLAHEPVAYILGHQEFYGRDFIVTPDVLIPRGDSETLIGAALELAPDATRVLDPGTGSGALLLTYLAETGASGIGIDASAAALSVAQANAEKLGLGDKAQFHEAEWSREGWADDLGKFDLILCNPPYVEDAAPLDRSVRDYEPASALFAGPEGLADYRVLMPQIAKLLAENGTAIFEIGSKQVDPVTRLAENCGYRVRLHRDLAGRPRALSLKLQR